MNMRIGLARLLMITDLSMLLILMCVTVYVDQLNVSTTLSNSSPKLFSVTVSWWSAVANHRGMLLSRNSRALERTGQATRLETVAASPATNEATEKCGANHKRRPNWNHSPFCSSCQLRRNIQDLRAQPEVEGGG